MQLVSYLALPVWYVEQDVCICRASVCLSDPAWIHSSEFATFAARPPVSSSVRPNAGSATLSAFVLAEHRLVRKSMNVCAVFCCDVSILLSKYF